MVFPSEMASSALETTLLSAPIEILAPSGHVRQASGIATSLGWAQTHDAEYVAVAQRERCPLVTRDARLRRGAPR